MGPGVETKLGDNKSSFFYSAKKETSLEYEYEQASVGQGDGAIKTQFKASLKHKDEFKLDASGAKIQSGVSAEARQDYIAVNSPIANVAIGSEVIVKGGASFEASKEALKIEMSASAQATALSAKVELPLPELCSQTLDLCVQPKVISEAQLGSVGVKTEAKFEHRLQEKKGDAQLGIGLGGGVGFYKGVGFSWHSMSEPVDEKNKSALKHDTH